MAFDVGSVFSGLNDAVSGAGNRLETQMQTMDPNNITHQDMIMMQMEVSKWQMMTSIQSNVMKALCDGIKGTIANFR
ncbi:MAG: EscF/YscF/HrpA family type III secretion system needle major subunit [Planctomycetota bacterium]